MYVLCAHKSRTLSRRGCFTLVFRPRRVLIQTYYWLTTEFEKNADVETEDESLNILSIWRASNQWPTSKPQHAPSTTCHLRRQGQRQTRTYRYRHGKWRWVMKSNHGPASWQSLPMRRRISNMRVVLWKTSAKEMKMSAHESWSPPWGN